MKVSNFEVSTKWLNASAGQKGFAKDYSNTIGQYIYIYIYIMGDF